MKSCGKCGESKPLEEFNRNKGCADGRRGTCKSCVSAYMRDWHRLNRDRTRAQQASSRREYEKSEIYKAQKARWRAANKERLAAIAREKYRADPERKLEQCRRYRQENPERAVARTRRWRKENPEARRAAKARRRQRRRVEMTALDKRMSAARRIEIAGDPCLYCGGPGEQDDHFFPLAKGGTDHWWNLVRACAACNNRKSARCGTWFILRTLDTRSSASGA